MKLYRTQRVSREARLDFLIICYYFVDFGLGLWSGLVKFYRNSTLTNLPLVFINRSHTLTGSIVVRCGFLVISLLTECETATQESESRMRKFVLFHIEK